MHDFRWQTRVNICKLLKRELIGFHCYWSGATSDIFPSLFFPIQPGCAVTMRHVTALFRAAHSKVSTTKSTNNKDDKYSGIFVCVTVSLSWENKSRLTESPLARVVQVSYWYELVQVWLKHPRVFWIWFPVLLRYACRTRQDGRNSDRYYIQTNDALLCTTIVWWVPWTPTDRSLSRVEL